MRIIYHQSSNLLDAPVLLSTDVGSDIDAPARRPCRPTSFTSIPVTRVGNSYVNRDMVGSVVGVQPFGDEGLSGTGPKVGGPHTLLRFAVERAWTVNTTAIGGNATLYTLDED